MDKVFEEERKHLELTKERINSIADRHHQKAEQLKLELNNSYTIDYEDIDQKGRLRKELKEQQKLENKYKEYLFSPYFGRMDLENDDDLKILKLYLGYHEISDGNDQIVYSWKSPVGNYFFSKAETEIKHNNFVYSLLLRRSLQIKNGKLLSYNTEYDRGDLSLGGDVIDPFLLTVLRDKRRHNRLTDIIKTIQNNQNTIIRKPEKESFIVQGCAGSGKTMILLHRLSVLAFNNRYKSYSHIKIITPNKFFNMHINELSRELELEDIERLSVEQFYVSLIKAYSPRMSVDPEVISEKTMGEAFLKCIYSNEFQKYITEKYNQYWNNTLVLFKNTGTFSIFKNHGVTVESELAHSVSSYENLNISISKLLTDSANATKKIEELQQRIVYLDKQRVENKNKYDSLRKNIKYAGENLQVQIDEALAPFSKRVNEIQEVISDINLSMEDIKNTSAKNEAARETILKRMSKIDNLKNEQFTVERLDSIDSFLSYKIKEKCDEQIKKIQNLYDELRSVPVYNFAKRTRTKNSLSEENENFSKAATSCLIEYRAELVRQLNAVAALYVNNNNRLTELDEKIITLSEEQKEILSSCQKYLSIKNAFVDNDAPNLKDFVSQEEYDGMKPIFIEYEALYKDYQYTLKEDKLILETKEKLHSEINAQEEKILSPEEKLCMEEGAAVLNGLSANSVYKNVFLKEMRSLYKENKERYTKDNYRHKVYIKLLYAALYFRKAFGLPSFINIDEAQDLSIAEYKLLKNILGNSCIFNLYGDVNQLVYSYKGITDWTDVQEIISSQLYFLNEDYRNTVQITEHCNKEFGAEILPIGISGKDVVEQNITQAVTYILDKHQIDPQKRNAIIYRNGIQSIQKELSKLLTGYNVSWDKIDDAKISVITVEEAKGIEFDNVVVITSQMSPNEKYISFTRALDELVVVNDKFAKNPEIEYNEENVSDDNIFETDNV